MSAYSHQNSNIRKTWILIFFFIGLVSAIFYGFATYYNQPFIAIIGLILSLSQAFVAYFFGDKIALAYNGAEEVNSQQAPRIHNLVENLTKIAGIPKPKIYISPDPSANAFACGRDPNHASICLNKGLLDILDKNELEGVIAHELSHIKNRDILVTTVTMVLASLVSFLADIGLRLMFWGGRRDDEDSPKNPVFFVIYLLVILLAPVVSLLIQMAVSRSREFLADATAVTITRYPEGLIHALEKLYHSPVPTNHYSTATSHFFIAPPKKSWGEKVNNLFSTHPAIEDRIQALGKM
jgi:heat shock protein HtpX